MGFLTEMCRRVLLLRHKPGHWRLRPGTMDRRTFREVVIRNEYRLPARFAAADVVLDVGGHIGSFSYAVLQRGAGVVCCCEPNAANFDVLEQNLRPFGDRVRSLNRAVWRSDVRVSHLPMHNAADPRNTAAHQVGAASTSCDVPAIAFDDLVDDITLNGARRIRLLKLDCEGSEWPILLTSRRLDRVDAICGEYHLVPADGTFAVAGHDHYEAGALERFLADQGFRVEIAPCLKGLDRLGLFFAERSNVSRGSLP